MILKLILSALLQYYLWVLWKYYRTDMAGLLGKTDDGERADEEAEKQGEPYTVIGRSTYGERQTCEPEDKRVHADSQADKTDNFAPGMPEDKPETAADDDADYSGIEIDEDEESEEDEYVPTPEELEEEEELGAYYPEGNPDFATGYTFEDLQKVHLVLTTDKPDGQARLEALEALPAVMGSDIYEAMMNELEGARERVARLMDKSIQ